jgi:hypothetical protein
MHHIIYNYNYLHFISKFLNNFVISLIKWSIRCYLNFTYQVSWLLMKSFQLDLMSFNISVLSQPHFEVSARMKLTLPKVGTWSPLGLSKIQSSIAKLKTLHIEVFIIPLERSWSVDVQNGLAWAFGHLQHKLWSKERSVWLPTTESRESTQS